MLCTPKSLNNPSPLIPLMNLIPKFRLLMMMLLGGLNACSFQQYTAKPIQIADNNIKLSQKNPTGDAFHQYLLHQGYKKEQLPIKQWDLNALVHCALFFNPSLDTTRAQWHAAELAEKTAAESAIPNIDAHIARNNRINEAASPYALGLSIGLPIETGNKRQLRIENAQHLTQVAKLEIAQTAWQLRHQVALTLQEYHFNQQQIQLLIEEETQRQEIVAMHQKRVDLGLTSNTELNTAKLLLQKTSAELVTQQQNKNVLLAKLSSHLGLPLSIVATMPLIDNPEPPLSDTPPGAELQNTALLNRLDIRIALERYAAVEAKLKLEIAKQYPNIKLNPGYAYEFGDSIWSLGITSLLTLLNKNKVAIAEATQLREIEAAQFEALQTKAIAEISVAQNKIAQSKQNVTLQHALHEKQQQQIHRIERQFIAGEIDRLDRISTHLNGNMTKKNVALAHHQLNIALLQLENTLQHPLSSSLPDLFPRHAVSNPSSK